MGYKIKVIKNFNRIIHDGEVKKIGMKFCNIMILLVMTILDLEYMVVAF